MEEQLLNEDHNSHKVCQKILALANRFPHRNWPRNNRNGKGRLSSQRRGEKGNKKKRN